MFLSEVRPKMVEIFDTVFVKNKFNREFLKLDFNAENAIIKSVAGTAVFSVILLTGCCVLNVIARMGYTGELFREISDISLNKIIRSMDVGKKISITLNPRIKNKVSKKEVIIKKMQAKLDHLIERGTALKIEVQQEKTPDALRIAEILEKEMDKLKREFAILTLRISTPKKDLSS